MADAINVTIDAREAIATLAATRGVMDASRAVHDAAANAVAVQVRGWFIARNVAKSRHTSSQYGAQAAEAVSAEADADSGRVVVRHPGTAWHRYGGTISAKPGKALAIPLRDEVYGVWPSEFFKSRDDAFVWRSPKGHAFLVAAKGKGAKSGSRTLRILYLLLKSVSKGADTTVLPSEAEQVEAASAAVRQLIRLALARRAAQTGAA